jgi:predicted enzyme related to lactoylglutathione lyase
MSFKSSTNIAIHLPDLQKAREFYESVLEFEVVEETEDHLVLETGSLTLYVVRDTHTMAVIPSLDVPNLDEAIRHVTENGAKVIRDWGSGKSAYFEDPFGLVWDLLGS